MKLLLKLHIHYHLSKVLLNCVRNLQDNNFLQFTLKLSMLKLSQFLSIICRNKLLQLQVRFLWTPIRRVIHLTSNLHVILISINNTKYDLKHATKKVQKNCLIFGHTLLKICVLYKVKKLHLEIQIKTWGKILTSHISN